MLADAEAQIRRKDGELDEARAEISELQSRLKEEREKNPHRPEWYAVEVNTGSVHDVLMRVEIETHEKRDDVLVIDLTGIGKENKLYDWCNASVRSWKDLDQNCRHVMILAATDHPDAQKRKAHYPLPNSTLEEDVCKKGSQDWLQMDWEKDWEASDCGSVSCRVLIVYS